MANKKIRDLYDKPNIVGEIKSNRLRWLGHVEREQHGKESFQ